MKKMILSVSLLVGTYAIADTPVLKGGTFDVYDNSKKSASLYRNDRNISTKIVGDDINLTIGSFDTNNKLTRRGVEVKVTLIDDSGKLITLPESVTFPGTSEVPIIFKRANFILNKYKAYRKLKVQVDYCSGVSKKTNKEVILPWPDCLNATQTKTAPKHNSIDYRDIEPKEVNSSDDFAFRPDRFYIDSDDKVYTGDQNVSFIIYQKDSKVNKVWEHNQTVETAKEFKKDVNLTHLDNNCGVDSMNVDLTSGTDKTTISGIGYGDINFSMKEENGSEFAKVDEDDTPDSQRFITPYSKVIKVLPYEANVSDMNITEVGQYTFSNTENNFSKVGIIPAVAFAFYSKKGKLAKDFNSTCGIDFNLTFKYNKDNNEDVNMSYGFDKSKMNLVNKSADIEDLNKTFTISKDSVDNGKVDASYNFNADKNISILNNPIDINFTSVNLDDGFTENDDNMSNSTQDDGNKTIFYGKIVVGDVTTYYNEKNSTILYEIYDEVGKTDFKKDSQDPNWKIVPTNESAITDINYTSGIFESNVSKNVSKGQQDIIFTLTTNSKPTKVKVHIGVEPYLWVSDFDEKYKAPSNSNRDCLTHYCSTASFLSSSKGWIGISLHHKDTNASKRAVDINTSNKSDSNNAHKTFMKLFW